MSGDYLLLLSFVMYGAALVLPFIAWWRMRRGREAEVDELLVDIYDHVQHMPHRTDGPCYGCHVTRRIERYMGWSHEPHTKEVTE